MGISVGFMENIMIVACPGLLAKATAYCIALYNILNSAGYKSISILCVEHTLEILIITVYCLIFATILILLIFVMGQTCQSKSAVKI